MYTQGEGKLFENVVTLIKGAKTNVASTWLFHLLLSKTIPTLQVFNVFT
jgi:hypothetical protein